MHGFGFSFVLRDSLQFAGDHLVTSLLAFNIGVEIGQLAVLLVLIPALNCCSGTSSPSGSASSSSRPSSPTPPGTGCSSAAASSCKFPFPTLDAAFLASAMRGLMAMLILALAVLLANGLLRRWIATEKINPAKDVVGKPPAA